MTIEKINFQRPRNSTQTVFLTEEMTALELAAVTAGKVDEMIEAVNGVEQSAIEATGVVDEMRTAQEQFMTENNDIRQQLITDNQDYIDDLTDSKTTFETNMNTSLSTFQSGINTSKTTFETDMNATLDAFEDSVNTSKTTFETNMTNAVNTIITNAETTIEADVNTKINALVTDGTLENLIAEGILTDITSDITTLQTDTINITTKIADFYSVKHYGAKGDGVTDDTAAIQNAINSVPLGGILFFPVGVYIITSRLNVTRKVNIIGVRGSSILKGDCDLMGVYSENIVLNTTLNGATGMTSPSIVVNDVAGVQAGQIVSITDVSVQWPYDTRVGQYYGELNIVKSVDVATKTVTLWTQTSYDYANATTIRFIEPIKDIEITGLTFEKKTKTTNVNIGLGFQYTYNALVKDIVIDGFGGVGCVVNHCVNQTFTNVHARHSYYDGTGVGYGIQINDSQQVSVNDSTFLNCRRAVDISGAVPSRLCRVNNCETVVSIVGANDAEGFGTHGTADYCEFNNCAVYGSKNAYNARGINLTFNDCKAYGTMNYFCAIGSGYGHEFINCKTDKYAVANYDATGFIYLDSPNYSKGNKSLMLKGCNIKVAYNAVYVSPNTPSCDIYIENCELSLRQNMFLTTAGFTVPTTINVHICNSVPKSMAGDILNFALTKGTNATVNLFETKALSTKTHREISGATPPTTGDWVDGDICWSSDVLATNCIGWVCSLSGSPGTWKSFGILGVSKLTTQADSAAADVAALKADFNALLAKLRTANLLA